MHDARGPGRPGREVGVGSRYPICIPLTGPGCCRPRQVIKYRPWLIAAGRVVPQHPPDKRDSPALAQPLPSVSIPPTASRARLESHAWARGLGREGGGPLGARVEVEDGVGPPVAVREVTFLR